jgi:DNA-binding transcriptional LysR family regulator
VDRIEAMELFIRIVETGSFTDAAHAQGISRAVASKTVQALENRLGVRLLNRTTRRLSTTEAGLNFYQRALRIVADVTEAEEEAARHPAVPRGTLRLNAPVALGARYVVPVVTVDLTLNDRFVDLVDEGYDVVVRVGRLADSSLVARRLARCPVLLCAAPAYLERAGRPVHPADLARHACLAYSYGGMRDEWVFRREHPAPDRAGVPPGEAEEERVPIRSRFRANSGDAIQTALLAGLGVALQPCFLVADDLRHGRVERLLPGWSVPEAAVHAVWPAGRHLSAKVRSFVDFLARRFAPLPPWDIEAETATPARPAARG